MLGHSILMPIRTQSGTDPPSPPGWRQQSANKHPAGCSSRLYRANSDSHRRNVTFATLRHNFCMPPWETAAGCRTALGVFMYPAFAESPTYRLLPNLLGRIDTTSLLRTSGLLWHRVEQTGNRLAFKGPDSSSWRVEHHTKPHRTGLKAEGRTDCISIRTHILVPTCNRGVSIS